MQEREETRMAEALARATEFWAWATEFLVLATHEMGKALGEADAYVCRVGAEVGRESYSAEVKQM